MWIGTFCINNEKCKRLYVKTIGKIAVNIRASARMGTNMDISVFI